jgi:hypothetical protein
MIQTRLNASGNIRSARSEIGNVTSYDPATGNYIVYTESGRQLNNPMVCSPYYSRTNFNGFFFIPRVGDTYLIDYTTTNVPFIVGSTAAYSSDTQLVNAINTLTLHSGDYGFLISPSSGGMASGGLIFKNTGSILLQSNPFTSIFLVPSNNSMIANLNTIHLTTLLGNIDIAEDEFGGVLKLDLQDVDDATTVGNVYSFSLANSTGLPLYQSSLSRLGEVNVSVGANLASMSIDVAGNMDITAKTSVGISAQSVLLGSNSASDPAVLGNEVQKTLNDIKTTLSDIFSALTTLVTGVSGITAASPGTTATASMPQPMALIQTDIAQVTSAINTILSKVVVLV